MNISITPELEQFVHAQVQTGMYNSASEVIREALRLLQERKEMRRMRIEQLNREIKIGLDQFARGEVVTAEELEASMNEYKKEFFRQRNGSL